ncbi:DUF3237 domain-containing protein [Sphingomonas sp. G-3-2-10]|uniref:DUF3237 domain-containing protein n=1 Tax=Sphingomonas sp. G-3-2-10 TaxID=2728838 RepID=UPI00146EA739|nr:DUF3237 domain-containing protein [Sphingomonas sp. G-3-2-10]NML05858.1 DUF3237 domain-containing protein [Sphingomonas sp. G-3-2-10]
MAGIETLSWEPLFVMRLDVSYAEAQLIGGQDRLGIFPVVGGSFEGPRLRGRVLPHGADWVTWQQDGTMNIDVRTALETDDGARIAMHYTGIAAPTSPEAANRFRNRQPGPYEDLYLHTTPRFVTDHPDYLWLNRTIAVTNGMRAPEGPVYHVFAIR